MEFDKRVTRALNHLFGVAEVLKASTAPEQFALFAQALADASAELDLGVLEVIYREHPDLRPANMPWAPTMREVES